MFAKLWKGTFAFNMSFCPHATTRLPLDGFFMKFGIMNMFGKSVIKIQVKLKSNKNSRYFT
jgi:hypothetical protein